MTYCTENNQAAEHAAQGTPFKAVIIDLDGTLLHDSGEPDRKTVNLLQAFQKAGGIVVIATSRHLSQCRQIAGGLLTGDRGYVISSNGAYIYDSQFRLVKAFPRLGRQDYEKVRSAFPDASVTLVTDGADYIAARRRFILELGKNAIVNLKSRQGQKRFLLTRRQYDKLDDSIEKIIVHSASETTMCMKDAERYNIVGEDSRHKEIQHIETDKASAAIYLMQRLGIADGDIVAFGDDENDRKLLSHYPRSYAMGNASASIKTSAKYVTRSNNDGGIYDALMELGGKSYGI